MKSDPENQPSPPSGNGIQLCYRALPHYEKNVTKRKSQNQLERLKRNPRKNKATIDLLEGKNQPIPIFNEHQLAFLYLQEFYKKYDGCNISKLDSGALLNVLARASIFPDAIRLQAAQVRDTVRNRWAHAVIDDWSEDEMKKAFCQIMNLAQLLPSNLDLIEELKEDNCGSKEGAIPMKSFLLKLNKYRKSLQDNKIRKVKKKLEMLTNNNGDEVYLERRFKENSSSKEYSSVEQMLGTKNTVFLTGEAGAGKSSFAAKVIHAWSEGKKVERNYLLSYPQCRE